MERIDKNEVFEKLREAFIRYQYRLENPFPNPLESDATMIAKFQNDVYFRAKVDNLACGVMQILEDFI